MRACSLLLVAAAVSLATPALAQGPSASGAASPAIAAQPLAELAIHPDRTAPAQSLPANESRLSAEVSARIVELPYDVGQVVKRGATVAKLDPRDFELAVARARAGVAASQARIAQAESQLERARALEKQKFVSAEVVVQRETELAVQRADLAVQQAALATAQRDLEKTTVRAPFDAIVKERHVGVGELASPGSPLVTLVDTSRYEVSAQVQVRDAPSLQDAGKGVFVAEAQYPVRLIRISPAVSRESSTVEVRLAFEGRAAAPGTSGRLVWRDPRPHLPPELVVRREGRLGVFVMKNGTPEFVPLPEAQEGRPVAVTLPRETLVVTDGRNALTAKPATR